VRNSNLLGLGALILGLVSLTARAQTPAASETLPAGAAAVVNGQVIPEIAVWRGLEGIPADRRDKARAEVLNLLIDNAVLDQYVLQMQVKVTKDEVDKKMVEGREELKKAGKDFDKMMKDLKLTDEEIREHVAANLRWDKFTETQTKDDKALQALFADNKDIFNGSQVRARHILLTPPAGDAKAAEAAASELRAMKKQIETKVAAAVGALPASADNLMRERERMKALDKEFAALAEEKSACPTKAVGGDVNWFSRDGMVEPFSKAAFALQPLQMSDVVQTAFGYHLILVTDRKPGVDIKFEEVKEQVREFYCERLRDAIVAKYRPSAKIKIAPQPPAK
jgi:parvulin-like peptidyl-prolyl isomerase